MAQADLPDELDDRAQDIWEPLLALAGVAGGAWREKARKAALDLSAGGDDDEDSNLALTLLRDTREIVFGQYGYGDTIHTKDLIASLCSDPELDRPWREKWWQEGWGDELDKPKAGAANNLAYYLAQFGIKQNVYVEGVRAKGYRREAFENAWKRYLGPEPGVVGVTADDEARADW